MHPIKKTDFHQVVDRWRTDKLTVSVVWREGCFVGPLEPEVHSLGVLLCGSGLAPEFETAPGT